MESPEFPKLEIIISYESHEFPKLEIILSYEKPWISNAKKFS